MNSFRLFGFRMRLHPLFVLIMLISILTGYFVEMATLFGIVLIHELGHAAAAKSLNWRVKQIELLPFGGVAEVEEQGTVPAYEEIIVALAGPLQNALMIGFGWLMFQAGWWDAAWTQYFIQANLIIGLFNLLPVLPLDGGKVMLAVMSYLLPYYRTLVVCLWMSLLFSFVICVYSFIQAGNGKISLNLLAIGLFLFYSNFYSYRQLPYHFLRFIMYRELRADHWVKRGSLAQPLAVAMSHSLERVVKMYMRERLHFIFVMGSQGQIRAVIPEKQLNNQYLMSKPGSAVSELLM